MANRMRVVHWLLAEVLPKYQGMVGKMSRFIIGVCWRYQEMAYSCRFVC